MFFSLSSVINNFLVNSIFIMILLVLLKFRKIRKLISIQTLLFACLVIIIRSMFPFEFFFTRSIYLKSLYFDIFAFFRTPLLNVGNREIVLSDALFIFWLIGSAILLIRLVIQYQRISSQLNDLDTVTDPAILNLVYKINVQFKKHVKFVLKSMPYIKSPFISNLHQPVIVIPQNEYDLKELEYILRHEIYHYYCKHLHLKLFCEILAAMNFWNPFIYLLKKELYKSLEFNVDYGVAKSLDEIQRIEYMECILKTAKLQHTKHVPATNTIAFSMSQKESNVALRIQALMDTLESERSQYSKFIPTLIIVLCMLPYFIIFEPSEVPQEVQDSTFTLNYEISYLIDNKDGTYDLYVGSEYIATVNSIFDSKLNVKEKKE